MTADDAVGVGEQRLGSRWALGVAGLDGMLVGGYGVSDIVSLLEQPDRDSAEGSCDRMLGVDRELVPGKGGLERTLPLEEQPERQIRQGCAARMTGVAGQLLEHPGTIAVIPLLVELLPEVVGRVADRLGTGDDRAPAATPARRRRAPHGRRR